jgi:hypothetical protein
MRVRLLLGLMLALPGVAAAQGSGTAERQGAELAAASALLLWLGLFAAFGLLLFWGLPVAVAALLARGRGQHPASALLWAGCLGWIGVLVYLHRGSAKECPHCHTRVIAETALCYWCGGDTRPAPLPACLTMDA